MPHLELLTAGHAAALLAFEQENRVYFAASVPDRGDDYFAEFDARLRELLVAQSAGSSFCHVVVSAGGSIVGRVNLVDVAGGSAALGFRIAERAAGRGVASAAVRDVFALAVDYGLTELRAAARVENLASRAVLARTGFVPTGETVLSDLPGITYRRPLP